MYTVQDSAPYKRVKRTIARYTAHFVFIERSLLNHTFSFNLPNAWDALDLRSCSSASSRLLDAIVEPSYLNSLTVARSSPSILMCWWALPLPGDGWNIASVFLMLICRPYALAVVAKRVTISCMSWCV